MSDICLRCLKSASKDDLVYGFHTTCFVKEFSLHDAGIRFSDLFMPKNLKQSYENELFLSHNTSHFHGKFRKYSASLGPKKYILKFSSNEEYPDLARSEFLCNQIASSLGLDVPSFHLISFSSYADCFVVYNFMQKYQRADLKHIWHFIPEKAPYSIETLLGIIKTQTGRYSEIKKFIFLCLFDALIGNNDRHGRNIAFIVQPSGYILSPFYDNPSYLSIEEEFLLGADHSPRGAISTNKTDEPSMADYVSEFKTLGYDEILTDFKDRVNLDTIKNLIKSALISEKRKDAFEKLITKRYGELQNET